MTSPIIAKIISIELGALGCVFSLSFRFNNSSSLQRAGMKGVSYTYFTTENAKSARELIVILREASAHVPPQLEEMAMFGGGGGARSTLSAVDI
jgi:hypothetical protein